MSFIIHYLNSIKTSYRQTKDKVAIKVLICEMLIYVTLVCYSQVLPFDILNV